MKVLALFELLVGFASGFGIVTVLGSLAGISTPVWSAQFFVYWGILFAAPVLLVVGAALTLAGAAEKPAAMLMLFGSAILTCLAVYIASSIPAERARGALTLGLVAVVVGIVVIAFASDVAAYKIYRLASRMR